MQRVTVTTQGADGGAVVGQNFLKLGEGGGIFEHGELAVRIAGIVAGTEFYGVDMKRLEFLENRVQRTVATAGA